MERVNEFEVRPRTPKQREAVLDLLDASAALWNELTYNRRQAFFDDNSVWHATNPSDRYTDVLGERDRPTNPPQEQRGVAVVLHPQRGIPRRRPRGEIQPARLLGQGGTRT